MDGTRGLAAAGVALALAGCGDSSGSGSAGVGHAYRACERAVESQLRAPATADFSGVFGSTITEHDETVEVIGYVDSENGFGANIRTDFSCTVRHVGDNWELVDLQL